MRMDWEDVKWNLLKRGPNLFFKYFFSFLGLAYFTPSGCQLRFRGPTKLPKKIWNLAGTRGGKISQAQGGNKNIWIINWGLFKIVREVALLIYIICLGYTTIPARRLLFVWYSAPCQMIVRRLSGDCQMPHQTSVVLVWQMSGGASDKHLTIVWQGVPDKWQASGRNGGVIESHKIYLAA